MDSQLMEKEVLCILDTRQIQKFMFRSNAYVDTLGGSDLMTHILEDGIRFALQSIEQPLRKEEYDLSLDPDAPIPYFGNDGVLFQLMICAAGNAMFLARSGRLAQKLIRKVSRYYLDHAYSLNLAAAAVEKTDDLGRDDPDFAHEFQIIHNNGDDVNCMCNAELAFPFMDFFFENLKDASIGEVDGQRIPLYCCGGICFVTEESDFHTAFTMAEECCANAKKTARLEKNLRNGLAGSWIDFQICDSAHFQELDLLREKSFVTDANVNLALRPYCLDEEAKDRECAYGRFRERVGALHRLKREYGMRRLNRLGEGYGLERIVFMEQLRRLKERGIDLEVLLGAPFYRDEDRRAFMLTSALSMGVWGIWIASLTSQLCWFVMSCARERRCMRRALGLGPA